MIYEPTPQPPRFSLLEPPTPDQPYYLVSLCRYFVQMFTAVALYHIARAFVRSFAVAPLWPLTAICLFGYLLYCGTVALLHLL